MSGTRALIVSPANRYVGSPNFWDESAASATVERPLIRRLQKDHRPEQVVAYHQEIEDRRNGDRRFSKWGSRNALTIWKYPAPSSLAASNISLSIWCNKVTPQQQDRVGKHGCRRREDHPRIGIDKPHFRVHDIERDHDDLRGAGTSYK